MYTHAHLIPEHFWLKKEQCGEIACIKYAFYRNTQNSQPILLKFTIRVQEIGLNIITVQNGISTYYLHGLKQLHVPLIQNTLRNSQV